MKIKVVRGDHFVEPEIIINCRDIDYQIKKILSLLDMSKKTLLGLADGEEYIIEPSKVLYFESVDGVIFMYTKEQVLRTNYTLSEIETAFSDIGYFRASKSTVLNIHKIKSLKSEWGNRIDALLNNGEHIIISRRYAKELRAILREVSNI